MKTFSDAELNACISKIRQKWWEQFRETTFVSGTASITDENESSLLRSIQIQMYLLHDNVDFNFSRFIPDYLFVERSVWTLRWTSKVSFGELAQFSEADFDDTKFDCTSIEWDDPALPNEVFEAALLHFDSHGIVEEFQDADQDLDEFLLVFPNRLKDFVRDCINAHEI